MMYKKLLVPLDGSQISETVLPYARALGRALNIPAELLQVIDPESFRFSTGNASRQTFDREAEMRSTSVAYLQGVAETFRDAAAVQFSVEIGNPAEMIINKAAAESGSLIAMAAHGHSGVRRWLLGSVAYKVASVTSRPLLLVRAVEGLKRDGEAELKSLLVPLDGSELAEVALPHARELAMELLIELIVLRVCDLSTYHRFPRVDQIAEALKLEAKEYLEERIRDLKAQGIEELSGRVLEGDPAAEILDMAQKKPDNVVVIATHGRTGIKRWLLGSVTEHVIHHAAGPVLVIRAS